ncbi:MAG TPA: ATP-binding protein, partial [Candidatus Elarobacter sp.]|nr:ATP-binding protein [Candidatus Elarobacter sp.]
MTATEIAAEKPAEFPFEIRGGVLNSMGIQMYSTLGKCLVEFVANAYDGDAGAVELSIPFPRIEEARQDILKRARQAKAEGRLSDRDRILAEALPDDITVEIADDGTGMLPREIIDKFLPLNRQRRADEHGNETQLHSESGRRFVMGRKGLGKLAGFGAAERVTVTTKRAGQTFATRFVMDATKLRQSNLGSVALVPEYIENEPAQDKYTKITLSGLKSEACKYGSATITGALREAFWAIDADEFAIAVNGVRVEPLKPDYEYEYPPAAERQGDMADAIVKLDDYDDLP